jgi:hypothetical protein
MKLHSSPVVVSVAALILIFMAAMPADAQDLSKASNLLDGKTFIAQSGEKGKPASNKDTFVFRDGKFLSEGCNPWGFGDAPYQATDNGAAIRFQAETRSPTHGTMIWDGIVRGDSIEATNLWIRDRWYWKIKREYWYRGQLKK